MSISKWQNHLCNKENTKPSGGFGMYLPLIRPAWVQDWVMSVTPPFLVSLIKKRYRNMLPIPKDSLYSKHMMHIAYIMIAGSTVHIYKKHKRSGVLTPLKSTYGIQDSLPNFPSNINSVDAAVRVGATNKYYYFKDGTYYLGVG